MGIRRPAILSLIPVALLATLYIFLHVSFSITPHSRQSVIPLLFDGVPVFALYSAAIAACGLAIPRHLYKAACAPFVLLFVLLLVLPVGFEVSVIQFSHGLLRP
jgi:hypothetical protein